MGVWHHHMLADNVMTFQQQLDSLNGGFQDHQDICLSLCQLIVVRGARVKAHTWERCSCVCVRSLQLNPSLTHPYPLCPPALNPLCLPPRWFISPGCVLSTSRPPKGTAVSESPALSIAWRCSSGAPSSCRTMMISFTVATPVLYAQVQKNKTHPMISLFVPSLSSLSPELLPYCEVDLTVLHLPKKEKMCTYII